MPSLCRLHIHRCYSLKTLPDGLQYVTTLNELTIKDMPFTFCNGVQEGGKDFYKIEHVASVTLDNASQEFDRLLEEIRTQESIQQPSFREKIRVAVR